ncbi:MarR family winged helix-turn-helix transcriptional regulator [Labrys neptuniae]
MAEDHHTNLPARRGSMKPLRKSRRSTEVGGSLISPAPAAQPTAVVTGSMTMWSLVDLAVREIPRRFQEIERDAMRLCMSLHCGADLVHYDISATIREKAGSVPVIKPLLVLILFEEIEMRDLARLCHRSRAAISTLVDDMFEQGLVTRRVSPDDRRVVMVKITEAGYDTFRRLFAPYNKREQFWAGGLTADEQSQFVALLGKLVNSRLTDPDIRLRS